MAVSDEDRLRALIGEKIPDGGDETDTQFSTAQITQILVDCSYNMDRAAFEGWRLKAAIYADLVNVTEGNASRNMSDLHKHALDMAKAYGTSSGNLTQGRTRIGKIRRFGSE